ADDQVDRDLPQACDRFHQGRMLRTDRHAARHRGDSIERRGRRDVRRIDPPIAIGTRLRNARMNPARPSVVKIGGVAILIALLTLPTATIAPVPAWAQARSMDQRYSRDELAGDRSLRQ